MLAPAAPPPPARWTARRILKEIASPERRRDILAAFWRHADNQSKLMAQMQLAKALHFRDETIRKIMGGNLARLMNVKDVVVR